MRACLGSQFVNDLKEIHFRKPLRPPQQERQGTRGLGARVVFADAVERANDVLS